ncbi:L-arabinose isomerase [Hymenobacter sp. BT186]|uniref:L-arabinose isomerase n=1 Tax=Hymenobacter telluris TaxID=2816474 RepID=A0A939JF13_9BACT|nr:L-arabinose isomerase [Hymenobacter telluris]MBO0359952.1 L-arabinose isomerase [Hymenobacter telluris]MBW3375979.1 L-arabinose isomerase [Hymenobacter norwichensis]
MINISQYEAWFITGSQHLYGPETLEEVAVHSQQIAAELNTQLPIKIVYKPVLTGPEEIYKLMQEANTTPNCVGLIAWMHTFSPAKMWINGLKILQKPLAHLHTQFNRDIPWGDINMDFMNTNQSAHGDREFGFIGARMGIKRKVVVGHWQDAAVHQSLNIWSRVASAWADWQGARFVRFGDNMRYVAVTEGDKVEAEIKFGYSVNTYGIGDLVAVVNAVTDQQINELLATYEKEYELADTLKDGGSQRESLRDAARIEAGMRKFLQDTNAKGFTDTFEDLHGMVQLPGIATQRLMAEGYGFGGEGDWKTSALVRAMKVMGAGLPGGNSFMEDYTYHFAPNNNQVLGSHMLEICPTIAEGKVRAEIHPLGIGGKADPVRLVFNCPAGEGLNATIVDMGNRFRMIVNEVVAVAPEQDLPNLPVARVLWKVKPDLATGAAAWILAGGAHHTGFSQNLTAEYLEDFAEMAGIEYVVIDADTKLRTFKNELRYNEVAFKN